MDITLKKIELEKKHILDNLMQLYLHNISLSFPIDLIQIQVYINMMILKNILKMIIIRHFLY